MIKAITLSITILVLVGLGTVAALNTHGPTAEQLNGDISEIDHQLGVARGLAIKYQEGSALRTQVYLQISILETTRSMLDQKRRSFFRGISFSYSVNGIVLKPASVTALMEAQTIRVRAAVLKEQLAIAVLGLAAVPRGPEAGPQLTPKVGQTVDDKGAL